MAQRRLYRHVGPVYAVPTGALPDGTSVISGGFDGMVRVHRLADGLRCNGSCCSIPGNSDRSVKRPYNGLSPGTSDNDVWPTPENARAVVCDSGMLSGTSVKEERRRRCGAPRKLDVSHGPRRDPAMGQCPTIPARLLHSSNLRTQPGTLVTGDRGGMAHNQRDERRHRCITYLSRRRSAL